MEVSKRYLFTGAVLCFLPTIFWAESQPTAGQDCPRADACWSATLGDSTDYVEQQGIAWPAHVSAQTGDDAAIESSNPQVLPPDGLCIEVEDHRATVKLTPARSGFSTVKAQIGGRTETISLAVSPRVASSAARFHLGTSDASTAVQVGRFTAVGSDEDRGEIYLYDLAQSGPPAAVYDFTEQLQLADVDDGEFREIDVEGSVKRGDRIYWIGSHSNNKNGKCRPNRYRLMATDVSPSDAPNTSVPTLHFAGAFSGLRKAMRSADSLRPLGLKEASDCPGHEPKDKKGRGFNIEALEIGPDQTTAFIGFRAPLVGPKREAIIVTLADFEGWFAQAVGSSQAVVSKPAPKMDFGLLDLGGRGIRSLARVADGYLILAGAVGGSGPPPRDFQLFAWEGKFTHQPVAFECDFNALDVSGSYESIVNAEHLTLFESSSKESTSFEVGVLIDSGTTDWYGTGEESKKLPSGHQKFRSDRVACKRLEQVKGS